MRSIKTIMSTLLVFISCITYGGNSPEVKVAALNFGTVNWELDVIKHYGLDSKYGFELKVMPVAGKNAAAVALNSSAVDLIFTDWVWVNRQRYNGFEYLFSPVSSSTGAVFVQERSSVNTLLDFNGERLGIAGGSVDKSWLILQAYYKHKYSKNINKRVNPVYAAPPLLNKLMEDDKLPAVINFWHYSARLDAQGFKKIIQVSEMLEELGVDPNTPFVGWVFSKKTLDNNSDAINGFVMASKEARQILKKYDSEWDRIKPLVKADNYKVFEELKSRYRIGVVEGDVSTHIKSLTALYKILATEGGKELTGGAKDLDAEMFFNAGISPSALIHTKEISMAGSR